MIALLLALSGPAAALDGNDALALDLVGGAHVEGGYVGVDDGILRLSGDNRFVDVPVDQVVAVERDGEPFPLSQFLAEVAEAQQALDALRAAPPAHPPPAVVGGASLVYAGAGHMAMGEWKAAAGWAAMDTVILGAAAWNLFGERSIPATIPVLALDLVIKAAAAGDAARIARRRRRQLAGPLAP
ncbi:MAG: hypothetical protein D6798_14960 [Deltaproteobacteria bacterium]|nr:MAG: hypothetical protein D6798_14960 [Deltaproteobacteria bacterium]